MQVLPQGALRVLLMLLLCSLTAVRAFAHAPYEVLPRTPVPLSVLATGSVELHSIAYFTDASATMPADAVLRAYPEGFDRVAHSPLAPGFSASAYWIYTELENDTTTTREFYLELARATLDHVDLYEVNPADKAILQHRPTIGRLHPVEHQSPPHHQPLFRIALDPGEKRGFLLRAESISAMALPVYLHSIESFYQQYLHDVAASVLYLGVVLAMVAYNFFLFVSFRDRSYLYYSLASMFMCGFMLAMEGWHYNWMADAYWLKQRVFVICLYGTLIVELLFTVRFLEIARYCRRCYLILRVFTVINALLLPISLMFYDRFWILLTEIMGLSTLLVTILAAVVVWRRGMVLARLFLLAWGATFASAFITVFAVNGWLYDSLNFEGALKYGQIIEVILMSFALADRINLMRNERESALQQLHLSNARVQAKSQFLAHMSHEVRTPMNGVIGLTELLGGTPLNPEQRQYVDTISRSAKSLVAVINDILDFSKLEAGDVKLQPRSLALQPFVNEVMAFFVRSAHEKHLELRYSVDPQLPDNITVDAARLRQVLVNLLSNAIKFTEQGHVSLSVIREPSAHGAMLCFCVEDTGPGIPASFREKIFNSFEQADSETSRRYDGMGLGLAISKKATEVLGGTLDYVSAMKQGTRFFLHIPLDVPDSVPSAQLASVVVAPVQPQDPHKKHGDREPVPDSSMMDAPESAPLIMPVLMIVEDNAINQMVIKGLLKKLGYLDPLLANNGEEALALYDKAPPDVILMDCHMPVMDGFEATRQIRRRETGSQRHTPIIAVTADVMVEHQERCQAVGMDDFVPKPVDRLLLQEKLTYWLTRHSPTP